MRAGKRGQNTKTGPDPGSYEPALHPFLMKLSGSRFGGFFNSELVSSGEKSLPRAALAVTEFELDFRGKYNKRLFFFVMSRGHEAEGNRGGGGRCLGKI